MSLSSSLFSGISGLSSLGNAMQIIGDNIANVNTVGFKGSAFSFNDLLSQSISTLSGTSQVGRGTAIGDIFANFEQGSFEATSNATDMAIGGDGFFQLKDANSDSRYYTRAGNFGFDMNGYLTNPEGLVVQGWALDENGEDVGSVTNILLTSFTSPPQETDHLEVIVNLDSDGEDNTDGSDQALANLWDGTADSPLEESDYEYQTTALVYDSLGSTHELTIYFDKADTASSYEFVVTCNPEEDNRTGAAGNAWVGKLAHGVLTFDTGGAVSDIDVSTIDPLTGNSTALDETDDADLTEGYFTFSPTFITGDPMTIKLDFGANYNGTKWVSSSLTTTQYASASNTVYEAANGFGAGDLENVSVDVDGIITGHYSNGQLIPLYRVALAKFQNTQGLFKEGGNLYSQTRESGAAITNKPGTNGLGAISSSSLEQSNVDIADELVKMITTQRGFQANSKIITVTDTMLNDLINIKR